MPTEPNIPGYTYGQPSLEKSPVSLDDLERLKLTVDLKPQDVSALKLAGEILADQTARIVDHWRVQIIGKIPHLAAHSRTPAGQPIPDYSARSGKRFEQWIIDTCTRPYDQDWLNYQHEIARRHTTENKNRTDGADSTPFIPLRDILAFVAVMNEIIKPYLAAKGHSLQQVNAMHYAWCKSLQLQLAIWTKIYMGLPKPAAQW